MLEIFDYVIVFFALTGIVINILGFVAIWRKQKQSRARRSGQAHGQSRNFMFHELLQLLMIYDIFVVICCLMHFALPTVWSWYSISIRPYVQPYLLPIMHVAVMSSVYCTILISFERYIRICYICQLRSSSVLTEDNFKFYKLFVYIFPVLFYIPKFFEIRTQPAVVASKTFNCHLYLAIQERFLVTQEKAEMFRVQKGLTKHQMEDVIGLANSCYEINFGQIHLERGNETLDVYENQEHQLNRHARNGQPPGFELLNLTLTEKVSNLQIVPTELRMNPIYYKLYYVAMNTVFASLLPLILLLFLNMKTARQLLKMNSPSDRPASSGDANQESLAMGSFRRQNHDDLVHDSDNDDQDRPISGQRDQEGGNGEEVKHEERARQKPLLLTCSRSVVIDDRRPPRLSSQLSSSPRSRSVLIRHSGSSTSDPHVVTSSRERKLAYISLYIVWLFLFCHVWKLVPTAYEMANNDDDLGITAIQWPTWVLVIEKISHTLITANSAVNFIIYVLF